MTMKDGLCECCGKKGPLVGVASIPFIPMSIAWCQSCLHAGVLPYWAAVANTASVGGIEQTNEGWQNLVEITLEYFGKSKAEFLLDVTKAEKELVNGKDSE